MKHCLTILTIAIFAVFFTSCKEGHKENNLPVASLDEKENIPEDTTVYGICVDATSNTVMIVNSNGDSILYVCNDVYDEDGALQSRVVLGGKFVGDKLAVIGTIGEEENLATSVINLTSLMGRWTSLDRDFEIKDGGVVGSNITAESNPYTSWKIINGRLVLSKDTFYICDLGQDSLVLENDKGIFSYKRKTNE